MVFRQVIAATLPASPPETRSMPDCLVDSLPDKARYGRRQIDIAIAADEARTEAIKFLLGDKWSAPFVEMAAVANSYHRHWGGDSSSRNSGFRHGPPAAIVDEHLAMSGLPPALMASANSSSTAPTVLRSACNATALAPQWPCLDYLIDVNRRRRPALYPAQTHSAGLNLHVGAAVLLVQPPA